MVDVRKTKPKTENITKQTTYETFDMIWKWTYQKKEQEENGQTIILNILRKRNYSGIKKNHKTFLFWIEFK